MRAGILDFELGPKPLRIVSPSRYRSLEKCRLREVWSAAQEPTLLPTHPLARLGMVIHTLLEEASSGKLVSDGQARATRRWDELVMGAENAMMDSWLDAHLVPLRLCIRDYEVRRIRAINLAIDLSDSLPTEIVFAGSRAGPSGSEFWVQSRSGLVGGYIDRVKKSAAGPILQDYKTGSIRESEPGKGTGQIKESHIIQIRLYAALYAESTGTWPHKLELVPLQGDPIIIDYDPAESIKLLEQASETLYQVNEVITSSFLTREEVVLKLANPSGQSCRFCQFRPGCLPYHVARTNSWPDIADWPKDLWGEIAEIRQVGNSKMVITISSRKNDSQPHRVRDINPFATRHPALDHLNSGDSVGLYNLKLRHQGGAYSESKLTTIYMLARDPGEYK